VAGHRIPGATTLVARGVGTVYLVPTLDFLLDAIVLYTEPQEALSVLTIDSVRMGMVELLLMPAPASLFSAEQVFPGAPMGPIKDPMDDVKKMMLSLWNVMQGRSPNDGIEEEGEAKACDERPRGTTIGPVFVAKDVAIQITVRSALDKPVVLGACAMGRVP
jgi:hypothetical protein